MTTRTLPSRHLSALIGAALLAGIASTPRAANGHSSHAAAARASARVSRSGAAPAMTGREVIWMSERDGWSHLYLIDGATGAVKNQIIKGPPRPTWTTRTDYRATSCSSSESSTPRSIRRQRCRW